MIYSFEAVINENSRILILGSLPGAKSLAMNQYYADPRNQFWPIIYAVLKNSETDYNYEARIKVILDHGLALWDVVHQAERTGSLDKNIKKETANDIPQLVQKYPRIKRIILGGGKAAKIFNYYFPDIGIETITVPSTSPIPGKYIKSLDEKIQIWRDAILDI